MIEIIYDDIPYGSFPMYYTDDTVEFYTVSGIINIAQLIKIDTLNKKRILLPLFEQQYEKSYPHKCGNYNSLSKIIDDNYRTIKSIKKISPHIIKLFENHKRNELKVVSWGETNTFWSDKSNMNCIWSRKLGYLGIKFCGDTI